VSDATIAGTDKAGSQDGAANKAIREVASKPSTGMSYPRRWWRSCTRT